VLINSTIEFDRWMRKYLIFPENEKKKNERKTH
jgi:hypothetical protein